MSQTESVLEARYGRKKNKQRPLIIAGVAIVSAIFFSFAIYASFFGKPLGSVQLTSFAVVDSNHIKGNFFALTGDQPVSCVFKAYNGNGAIVGYAEVEIPANTVDSVPMSTIVKTVVPAAVLKADGCAVK